MLFLSKQLLQSSFLAIGYSPLDYLYTDQIQKSLNQLNQEQFDIETFEELLNQCKSNSKGQIKLDDVIMTFIKAENILVQKAQDIKRAIEKINSEVNQINRAMTQKNRNSSELQQQMHEEIEELKEEATSNNINLEIIRKPFTNHARLSSVGNSASKQPAPPMAYTLIAAPSEDFPLQNLLIPSNTHTFTWIFELSCILLAISLPCLLYHNNFMNILILAFIVTNFISGYFCRNILRAWMYLLVATVIIDIVWFIIGARYYWVSHYVDWPQRVTWYLRLIVVFQGVITLAKLILVLLFLSEYNTDQSERKTVSVFGFAQLELSHDQDIKNMFRVLNKNSHSHHPEQGVYN